MRKILLTAEEADEVIVLMRQSFGEYVVRYDEEKYPPSTYDYLRKAFAVLSQVADDDIRTALLWKFGHIRKNRIPRNHENLIWSLQREWPALCPTLNGPAAEVYMNLKNANNGRAPFITVAFLVHLLRPSDIPIIDQHNFRAMNYYCRTVRPAWQLKPTPSSYKDLVTLSSFLSDIRSRWTLTDELTAPDERELDRFLMMFGKTLKDGTRKTSKVSHSHAPTKLLPRGQAENADPNDTVTQINLPLGGGFDAKDLVQYLMESGSSYIIQGQTNCRLSGHPKPHSLDVWLRRRSADNPDTKQAVNKVVSQLVSTGLFEEGMFLCPDSTHMCKGIRLVATA